MRSLLFDYYYRRYVSMIAKYPLYSNRGRDSRYILKAGPALQRRY
jgi:hypothetical protein